MSMIDRSILFSTTTSWFFSSVSCHSPLWSNDTPLLIFTLTNFTFACRERAVPWESFQTHIPFFLSLSDVLRFGATRNRVGLARVVEFSAASVISQRLRDEARYACICLGQIFGILLYISAIIDQCRGRVSRKHGAHHYSINQLYIYITSDQIRSDEQWT